jgi:hypothetical protein
MLLRIILTTTERVCWVSKITVSFYVLLTVLPSRYNSCKWPTWHTVTFFYMFISTLYTFRANSCSSSGESIVSIQHLVCVTLCRWSSKMQIGKELPDLHTRRSEWHIPDVEIQLILLMMRTRLLETCRELKYKYRKEEFASSWSFTRINVSYSRGRVV